MEDEPLIPRAILIVLLALLLFPPMPVFADDPSPTPSPTARPMVDFYMDDLVDMFRIENSWKCGGSIHDCVANESDPLIMTRVAMAEAPGSLNDRIYVMWNIKMRAALGFKNARYHSGPYNGFPDRWGPETTIAQEALCFGGCQFEVMRAAQNLYFGCGIPETTWNRVMFCPTDEQFGDFYATYLLAIKIVNMDLVDMPREMWGYDGFRSPQISWYGRIDYQGGLPSRAFYKGGNVWRDEYPKDNAFWDDVLAGITPTPIPSPTPTHQPGCVYWDGLGGCVSTGTPTATATEVLPTATASAIVVTETSVPQEVERSFEMKGKVSSWFVFMLIVMVSFLLMAFQVVDESRMAEIITGIVGFAIMLFGPRPLKGLFNLLKIPDGPWRVFATYVASGLFGVIVLLIAGAFVDVVWNMETVLAFAGALSLAAQMAYHRLKDLGDI